MGKGKINDWHGLSKSILTLVNYKHGATLLQRRRFTDGLKQ
jgi:hypothetical protein